MRNINYFLPNKSANTEVFLFKDYELIECNSSMSTAHIGESFAHICELLDLSLPCDSNYLFCRRANYTTTIKECGAYQLIINSKPVLHYVQTTSFGS